MPRRVFEHDTRTPIRLRQTVDADLTTMAATVQALGLKQRFTKPYAPRTNGKAERFIQTSLREWAYAHAYSHSAQRSERLSSFLHNYNWHRPHHALKLKTPASRLHLNLNNLSRLHS